jgi:hypothetical protein
MSDFSKEEQTEILEIARYALADGETFDRIAIKLDLTDEYMKELQGKIEKATKGTK